MWKEVGSATGYYVFEYQAQGYARTNCSAIRTGSGFVVLSPASNVSEIQIQFLEKMGPILALLVPHPGHTLGIKDWLALRPALKVYGAPQAIPRVSKVCKIEVLSIEKLPAEDPQVKITLAPGMGNSTLFIEVRRGDRPVVYVDEILEDLDRIPGPWFLRPLMRLFGKTPGFHVNRGFLRFFVKDPKALATEVRRLVALGGHVVFAHGPVRSTASDLAKTKELLETVTMS